MKRKSRQQKLNLEIIASTTIFIGFIGYAFLSYNSPSSIQSRVISEEIQTARIDNEKETYMRNLEAKKANDRYTKDCVMPTIWIGVNPNWYPKAIAIAEGENIITDSDRKIIKDGTEVCDDRGMTGIIVGGIVTDGARTDDGDIYNKRFADALGWHKKAQRSDVSVLVSN